MTPDISIRSSARVSSALIYALSADSTSVMSFFTSLLPRLVALPEEMMRPIPRLSS